jgi:hypothetical protein
MTKINTMSKKALLTILCLQLCLLLFSQNDFEGMIRYKVTIEDKKYYFSTPETDSVELIAYFSPGKILLRGVLKDATDNSDLLIITDSLKYYLIFHDKKETEEKSFTFKPVAPPSSVLTIKGYRAIPFTSSKEEDDMDATTFWLAEKLGYKFPGYIAGDDDVASVNLLIRNDRLVLKAQSFEGKRTAEEPGLLKTPVQDNQACTRKIIEAFEIKQQKNNPLLFTPAYLLKNPAR